MPRRNLRVSSPNYYVTTTANNRIKVWKLELLSHTTNQVGKLFTELFEPNYLKIHYTSIAIFDDQQNLNNNHNNCLLVLGDKVGRIVLFNITKSCKVLEISQHTKDASKDFKHITGGHHSRINSIQFDTIITDNNTQTIEIVTCSNDKKLCRWDLNGTLLHTISVGDNNPSSFTITCPFQSPKKKKKNKYLMVASNNINVWNITTNDNEKCIGSFQGHASQTRNLLLSEDNQYLISSGQDRFVYIWKCKTFYKKKHNQTNKNKTLKAPMYSLPLDDDVKCIAIKTITKPMNEDEINYIQQKKSKKKDKTINTKSVYLICAASKTCIRIWCFDPIKQSVLNNNSNLKHCVEITIADDANNNQDNMDYTLSWIQHIQFINDQKNIKLMVLRGTQSIPVIKQIQFIADDNENDNDNESKDDLSFIGQIVLENVNASFDIINGNHNIDLSANKLEEEKNGSMDKDLTVLHVADVQMANPKSYDQFDINVSGNDHSTSSNKRKRDDVNENESENTNSKEPPPKKQRVESESVTFQDKLYEIEKKTEQDKNKSELRIPNADSLYTLLTQSLKANDQTMFDRLLTMQNDEAMREFEGDMIKNTLDRISDNMAIDLLERLTEKFRVSPRQSISIMRWLLPLLNSHSATFSKNLSSRKYLISVNQAIDYQIKSLVPAMKLQGRLSLLTKQMDKVNKFKETQNNNANSNMMNGLEMARNKPLFVHDETQINDENRDNDLKINDLKLTDDDSINDSNDFIEI